MSSGIIFYNKIIRLLEKSNNSDGIPFGIGKRMDKSELNRIEGLLELEHDSLLVMTWTVSPDKEIAVYIEQLVHHSSDIIYVEVNTYTFNLDDVILDIDEHMHDRLLTIIMIVDGFSHRLRLAKYTKVYSLVSVPYDDFIKSEGHYDNK